MHCFLTPDTHNYRKTNCCCFKPLSLWQFATAAVGIYGGWRYSHREAIFPHSWEKGKAELEDGNLKNLHPGPEAWDAGIELFPMVPTTEHIWTGCSVFFPGSVMLVLCGAQRSPFPFSWLAQHIGSCDSLAFAAFSEFVYCCSICHQNWAGFRFRATGVPFERSSSPSWLLAACWVSALEIFPFQGPRRTPFSITFTCFISL